MTKKMFNWFSKDGVKRAPSICPANRATLDDASYRILFSQTPMKTLSQTTHGTETHTTTQPFNADVNSRTTYSDGNSANSTATIYGQQTSTIVVPTETTISRSSVALYMYTYRVNGNHLELIATDSVVFSRVAVSGSGDQSGYIIGAGIRNLVNKSGDSRRADKLYEEALNAIRSDAQDSRDPLENHAVQVAPVPLPVPSMPSTAQAPIQASLNIDSTPSGADIEIDGAFVGNTPSTISVASGPHQIAVKKKGFADWSKPLSVTGGTIHLNAELEREPEKQ
jgi:hypothetical protein